MKYLITFLVSFIIFLTQLNAVIVEVKNDNGTAQTNYQSRLDWEETAFLVPNGPCNILEVKVYFAGTTPALDTIFIVGDPAEGAVCPTFWAFPYSIIYPPIYVNYDGNPGWRTFSVPGLRSDGYDRICVQHKLGVNGPWFGVDNNGMTGTSSWLMDPNGTNSLGGPGAFYIANGDYMVRLMVEYDFPNGNTSLQPPAPVMPDETIDYGLVNSSGAGIPAAIVSVADWNNDGYDDVAIGSNYFQNNGDGFVNVTSKINISAQSTVWADVDNDGFLDCFAVRGSGNDKIYWGKADGTFLEETDPVVILNQPTVTPLWLDYDHDGLLDLFIAYGRSGDYPNEIYYQDHLFKNLGNRKFQDVTNNAQIKEGTPPDFYDCWGASVCDYNNDNFPDVFVATYRLAPDLLHRNNGNSSFTEVGAQTGVQGAPTRYAGYFGHGMGSDWGDYDNDGWVDLAVGNLGHPDWRAANSNPSLIFKNGGAPSYIFENKQQEMGLKFFEMNAGIVWLDLDHDGYLDLYHCQYSYDRIGAGVNRFSRLYMNQGTTQEHKLRDYTWEYMPPIHGAWSPVRFDMDGDGDMDLLVGSGNEFTKLYRNDLPKKGNWVTFRLKGSPANQVCNDAYGSNVTVWAGGKSFYRDLPGSVVTARCAQASNLLHFGIGNTSTIDSVIVKYPNGNANKLTNLEINTNYILPYMENPYPRSSATAQLISPANYSVKNPASLQMNWEKVSGAATYKLQVSEKADFSSLIFDENVIDVLKAFTNLENKTYYWRVQANITKEIICPWSSVWNFTVGIPVPSKPNLLAPADDSVNITAMPELSWTSSTYTAKYGTFTSYQLQLSTDKNFSGNINTIDDLTETSYQITTPLNPGNLYYWRVRGQNVPEYSSWSDTWSFFTMPLPNKPVLLSPIDGEEDVATRPVFNWEASQYVSTYSIQVAKDAQFSDIHFESDALVSTTFRLLKALAQGTVYYWHVKGNNDGGSSPWSDTRHFKVTGTIDVYENNENLFIISDNVPNPFSDITTIRFSVSEPQHIRITIYDALGCEIETLLDKQFAAGDYKNDWKPKEIESGVYYYKIAAGKYSIVKKVVYIK